MGNWGDKLIDTESFIVNIGDDPLWEIGDIKLLSISPDGSKESPRLKYAIIGKKWVNKTEVEYTLKYIERIN